MNIREFVPSDYDDVFALWRVTEGVTVRDVDGRASLINYLALNQGLSYIALDGTSIVGAVLGGTDGRRGYVQHLAMAPTHRRQGIGRALVLRVTERLAERGIDKCHLMVIADNAPAREFWARLGWIERSDIVLMSRVASRSATA